MEHIFIKVKEELSESRKFFNSVIGVLSFSFALACLSISNQSVAFIATISSIIMIQLIIRKNQPSHSSTLKLLRENKDRTPKEDENLSIIENNLFKPKYYSAADFGFFFLMLTFLYQLFGIIGILPLIQKLIGSI
jgi:hypothetical protein